MYTAVHSSLVFHFASHRPFHSLVTFHSRSRVFFAPANESDVSIFMNVDALPANKYLMCIKWREKKILRNVAKRSIHSSSVTLPASTSTHQTPHNANNKLYYRTICLHLPPTARRNSIDSHCHTDEEETHSVGGLILVIYIHLNRTTHNQTHYGSSSPAISTTILHFKFFDFAPMYVRVSCECFCRQFAMYQDRRYAIYERRNEASLGCACNEWVNSPHFIEIMLNKPLILIKWKCKVQNVNCP